MITYSIIQKSQLEGAHRLDAEYYQPKYLELAETLQTAPRVADLTSDIRYGLYVEPEYKKAGVDFIRALNLLNFWIDGEILKIDKSKAPQTYYLKTADSLIVRSGANTGSVALVNPRFSGATFGSYTIRLRFTKINPFFATVFLNTKFGVLQTQRLQTGMAQPNLNIPNIKEIKIPVVLEKEQKVIENLCLEIDKEREKSENFYSQAEDLLLEELGLKDFKVEDKLSYIINLSEIKSSHRADAEYWQPKYERLLSYLNKKFEIRRLKDLVTMKKGIEPGSDKYQEEGKPFIRVSNLSKFGINDNDQKYLADDFYQELIRDYQPKTGEILLSKDASPGVAYAVEEPIEAIVAGGILRLKVKVELEPEYLALVINSLIGQYQMEQDTGGSVIVHWRPEQIRNMCIPIIEKPTQQKIADLVHQSHEARKKAKQLLGEAKHKVEDAILGEAS